MTTYFSTIHVDVPPEVAFGQVVELMMKSSGRTRCTVLEAPPEGVGTKFRYEYRLFGHDIGGTCTLTEYVPNTTVTFQWHGPERFAVGDLRGVWAFTPDGSGTTITVQSIFEPRFPILHALAARAMIRGFRKTELPTMKAEMESRSRGAQPAS